MVWLGGTPAGLPSLAVRGGGVSLPWANLPGGNALHAWDFLANQARFNGVSVGALANTPNWTFTRASTAYYRNSSGLLTSVASGVLRTGDRGALIEGAATNLFLNSTAPVTQDINFGSTGNRTLSVWGSGSVEVAQNSATITGAGTATEGSPVTFNVTGTGTCTFTVTGSPTIVQVESGAFATSPIATTGSSATRAADSLTVTGVSGLDYPLTLYAEFERAVDTGTASGLLRVDNATNNERAFIYVSGSDVAQAVSSTGGVDQAAPTVAGAIAINTVTRIAARFSTNSVQIARGGTLGTEDTSATNPSSISRVEIGTTNGASHAYSYLRRLAIFSRALSDAELTAIST